MAITKNNVVIPGSEGFTVDIRGETVGHRGIYYDPAGPGRWVTVRRAGFTQIDAPQELRRAWNARRMVLQRQDRFEPLCKLTGLHARELDKLRPFGKDVFDCFVAVLIRDKELKNTEFERGIAETLREWVADTDDIKKFWRPLSRQQFLLLRRMDNDPRAIRQRA